jgi:hypothetical protein
MLPEMYEIFSVITLTKFVEFHICDSNEILVSNVPCVPLFLDTDFKTVV